MIMNKKNNDGGDNKIKMRKFWADRPELREFLKRRGFLKRITGGNDDKESKDGDSDSSSESSGSDSDNDNHGWGGFGGRGGGNNGGGGASGSGGRSHNKNNGGRYGVVGIDKTCRRSTKMSMGYREWRASNYIYHHAGIVSGWRAQVDHSREVPNPTSHSKNCRSTHKLVDKVVTS
ncbi:hypothetical protein ACOSQ3_003868 [Xanthoceras sorbifolium]